MKNSDFTAILNKSMQSHCLTNMLNSLRYISINQGESLSSTTCRLCSLAYLKPRLVQFLRNFLCTLCRGLVVPRRKYNNFMLCTSGFVDEIMFSHNGANGAE